jgi:hypothetical protein
MNQFTDIWGAIYVPARAYNPWQMWAEYDPAIMERDMSYAERVGLNAIRAWYSYERWLEVPDATAQALESALENCGVPFTPEAARDKDPLTAMDLISPAPSIIEDSSQWEGPREYVRWFVDRYRDDRRLLAIEIMNEPWYRDNNLRFVLDMFHTARRHRGSLPLTIGTASEDVWKNLIFAAEGSEVLQFHNNFPSSLEEFERSLAEAKLVERTLGRPVWLTEWQRVRAKGSGWREDPVHPEEIGPGLATLAPLIRKHQVGSFFWSLMVKPAYLAAQRRKGTLNGLFHEDGTVWSLEDARAISGDPGFEAEERREWPEWCAAIPQSLGHPVRVPA